MLCADKSFAGTIPVPERYARSFLVAHPAPELNALQVFLRHSPFEARPVIAFPDYRQGCLRHLVRIKGQASSTASWTTLRVNHCGKGYSLWFHVLYGLKNPYLLEARKSLQK